MRISVQAQSDLTWWIKNLPKEPAPLHGQATDYTSRQMPRVGAGVLAWMAALLRDIDPRLKQDTTSISWNSRRPMWR